MMNILRKSNLRISVFVSFLLTVPVIRGLLVLPVFLGTMSAMALNEFTVKRVSENAKGEPGNRFSVNSRISANGKFVVFSSFATNLIPNDTNGELHVFVKNAGTGEIVRVSEDASGMPGNDLSGGEGAISSISADSRFVAFESYATNLVPGDTNRGSDIFVKNVETGEIVRASENAVGEQGNSGSHSPSISADGNFVAFESNASNLVPGDTTNIDVFVKDMNTGEIMRVSENAEGFQGNGNSGAFNFDTGNLGTNISISSDGQLVAFPSSATNLVPNDTNDQLDVFVKNMRSGEIVRASENAAGIEGNGRSGDSGISLSADGRFVAFSSFATNLEPNDTNETDDVFVKNLETGEMVQVSENPAGDLTSTGSNSPSLSADGSFVVFQSSATSLVPGGADRVEIVVKNVRTSKIARVGEGGRIPSISADGRFVAFESSANNLVPDDTNEFSDIFLVDVAGMHTLTTPENLRFAVYSRTAAEVFWDRSPDERGIVYEVIRNGELIGVLDALSVFEDELQPDVGYTYLVTAMDDEGNRSATATVSFTTRHTDPSDPMNPAKPGNLRFQVYSRTAAEVFWNRPVGQSYLYRVYLEGVLEVETDGVSWWSDDFAPGSTTEVMVVAVDSNGVESSPAVVTVQTSGTSLSPVTGLRAAIYSASAAEIFWDRKPGVGHQYRIYADGVEVTTTNGTSWFSDEFKAGSTTTMTVVAVNGPKESIPQNVIVTTRGGN